MTYYTYILYSEKLSKYYVGQTQDVTKRLERHNRGYERFTKVGVPWRLETFIEFDSRSEAMKLERKLKNFKSQKRMQTFILERTQGGSSAKK